MKPLYQARYRGKPEWTWEYTTRGYTVTDLEKAKKPTYKWLEEAKKRDKPLQVQVVIVDPEKRWGEVVWEDFYLKDEFFKETERCQIVRDITKDLLEEECQTEDDKCRIAKEITKNITEKECSEYATKAKVDINAIEQRGVKGDDLLNVIDLIDEALSYDKTIEIDREGYVTLYHRTNKANADNINKTGYMTTKEPGLYFGSKPEGQIDGYGEAVVKVKIPIEKLELNDIFTNEVHFRLPEAMPGKKYKIDVLSGAL